MKRQWSKKKPGMVRLKTQLNNLKYIVEDPPMAGVEWTCYKTLFLNQKLLQNCKLQLKIGSL